MAYPISTKKNDYFSNRKKSTVITPLPLCKRIYDIVKHLSIKNIYDIGCNEGNLSYYFKDKYKCIGIDIEKYNYHSTFIQNDFLKLHRHDLKIDYEDLIVSNPPFNHEESKKGDLLPEVFLRHIFEIWGEEIGVIMFVPMGFRLNQSKGSERWKWLKNSKAKITSIMSLPIDIFPYVKFHAEVLFFNIPGIDAHYWIKDKDKPLY